MSRIFPNFAGNSLVRKPNKAQTTRENITGVQWLATTSPAISYGILYSATERLDGIGVDVKRKSLNHQVHTDPIPGQGRRGEGR